MDGTIAPAAPKSISIFRSGLTYLLGALWVAAFFLGSNQQSMGTRAPEGIAGWIKLTALATPPLCVLALGLWRNRAGFRAWRWMKRIGMALWLCVQVLAWAIVFGVAAGLMLPMYSDYTVRAKMAENVLAMSAARSEITEKAMRSGSFKGSGRDSAVPSSRWIDFSLSGTDGVVLTYNARYGVMLMIEPYLEGKEISWRCHGYPRRDVPGSCREKTSWPTSLDLKIEGTAAEHARALLALARPLRTAAPATRRLQPAGVMDFGYQDERGDVVLYSDRHGVLLVIEPGGACVVHPAEAAVEGCQPGAARGT